MARALERHPRFAERVFTAAEREYCLSRANPAQHFAARFAGKEAVGKALGFGVAVHVARDRDRRPSQAGREPFGPHGRVGGARAAGAIDLCMTHSKGMAAAVAVVDDA